MKDKQSNQSIIKRSFKVAVPICIGYLALGCACGILSIKAGYSLLEILLMSVCIYAGAGQFIAASMLDAGSAKTSIIITVWMVNLRHILMGTSLAPYMKNKSKGFLAFFSYEMTDETFGVNYNQFQQGDWTPRHAMYVNIFSHISWIFANVLGGILGPMFQMDTVIMNYVLTSMFIFLMMMQLKSLVYYIAAGISGVFALVTSLFTENNLHIIIATVIGATAGFYLEKYVLKQKPKGGAQHG